MFHADPWSHSPSLHTPSVVDSNDLPIPRNNSSGHAHQQVLSWVSPSSFLGNKVSCISTFVVKLLWICELDFLLLLQLRSYGGHLNYSLVYDIPLDNHDQSLPAHSDIIMEVRSKTYMHTHDIFQDTRTDPHLSLSHVQGNGQALRLSPPLLLFLSPLAERLVSVKIVPQQFVDDKTGVPVSRDDMMSVLADITSLWVRVHLNTSAAGPIQWVLFLHLTLIGLFFLRLESHYRAVWLFAMPISSSSVSLYKYCFKVLLIFYDQEWQGVLGLYSAGWVMILYPVSVFQG